MFEHEPPGFRSSISRENSGPSPSRRSSFALSAILRRSRMAPSGLGGELRQLVRPEDDKRDHRQDKQLGDRQVEHAQLRPAIQLTLTSAGLRSSRYSRRATVPPGDFSAAGSPQSPAGPDSGTRGEGRCLRCAARVALDAGHVASWGMRVPDPRGQGRSLVQAPSDRNVKAVIDALDSFYCHNLIVSLWADAVANRLEGLAVYLLSDELPEVAEHARKAAARLADRIGDLGGAITADPRQLLDRAPATTSSPSPTAPTPGRSPATRCNA